jgi:hypothetical protein
VLGSNMRAVTLVLVIVASGCGDNVGPCDYHERADLDNAQTGEVTLLKTGPRARSVCGTIDGGHYDPLRQVIDEDAFAFTAGGSGQLLVQMAADPAFQAIGTMTVSVFDAAANPTLYAQGTLDQSLADHGAFLADVPPGDAQVVVTARSQTEIVGALAYRVRLLPDPLTGCRGPMHTYREANDGGDDAGNDLALIDFTQPVPYAMTVGTPEKTGLRVDPGRSVQITGSAGSEPHTDQYLDRDSYELATAAASNELWVDLEWADPAVDLDFVVFEADTLVPLAAGTTSGGTEHEIEMFAVRGGVRYWLWVGRFHDAGPLPTGATSYTVTVCGGNYF